MSTPSLVPPRRWAGLLCALSVTALGVVIVAPAEASFPGANGRIAFSEVDLDATSPAGGSRVKLVDGADDGDYSADGTTIIYKQGNGLFVADRDGSSPVRVYTDTGSDLSQHPVFSPDGARIAFSVIDRSGSPVNERIITMRTDGSDVTGIAPQNILSGRARFPEFSPDGTKVVYSDRVGGGEYAILEAPFDGSSATVITAPAGGSHRNYYSPDYSPDGGKIVFHSELKDNNDAFALDSQLFSVPSGAANGTPTALTAAGGAWEFSAAYSPDGTRLTFVHGSEAAGYSLATMPAGGGGSPTTLLPLEYVNPQATYDFATDWGTDTRAVEAPPGSPNDPGMPSDPGAPSDPNDPGGGGDPNGNPACSDGLDNDGDRDVDYPSDGGCSSPDDDDESGGGPGGGGTVESDLSIAGKQRGTTVVVNLGCPEACTVSVEGRATIKGGKKRAATSGNAIPMKRLTKSLAARQIEKLKLKPKGKRSAKKLAKALKQGKKVSVAVVVRITEGDGDSGVFKQVVKLKR